MPRATLGEHLGTLWCHFQALRRTRTGPDTACWGERFVPFANRSSRRWCWAGHCLSLAKGSVGGHSTSLGEGPGTIWTQPRPVKGAAEGSPGVSQCRTVRERLTRANTNEWRLG